LQTSCKGCKPAWIKLENPGYRRITNAARIEDNKFIVLPLNDSGQYDFNPYLHTDGIYSYCTLSDRWMPYLRFEQKFAQFDFPSIAYCPKRKTVLLVGDSEECRSDLVTLRSDRISSPKSPRSKIELIRHNKYIGQGSCILSIDSTIHVIGGSDTGEHLIWNDEDQAFAVKHKCPHLNSFYGHQAIYIRSRQEILLFGLGDYGTMYCWDMIYSFQFMRSDKDGVNADGAHWTMLKKTMPIKIKNFASVLTSDERYILFFGGCSHPDDWLDSIYVLDVDTMDCVLSPVKCPVATPFSAVLIDDRQRMEHLVFGWLRRSDDMLWMPTVERSRFMYSDMYEPREVYVLLFNALPVELIVFLSKWMTTDWIHLLPESPTDSHWKVAAHDLIPCPFQEPESEEKIISECKE